MLDNFHNIKKYNLSLYDNNKKIFETLNILEQEVDLYINNQLTFDNAIYTKIYQFFTTLSWYMMLKIGSKNVYIEIQFSKFPSDYDRNKQYQNQINKYYNTNILDSRFQQNQIITLNHLQMFIHHKHQDKDISYCQYIEINLNDKIYHIGFNEEYNFEYCWEQLCQYAYFAKMNITSLVMAIQHMEDFLNKSYYTYEESIFLLNIHEWIQYHCIFLEKYDIIDADDFLHIYFLLLELRNSNNKKMN